MAIPDAMHRAISRFQAGAILGNIQFYFEILNCQKIKKAEPIDPAFLYSVCFFSRLFFEFSAGPGQSHQAQSQKQQAGGFGNSGIAAVVWSIIRVVGG